MGLIKQCYWFKVELNAWDYSWVSVYDQSVGFFLNNKSEECCSAWFLNYDVWGHRIYLIIGEEF